jgi:hypothetical protein
VTGTQPPTFGAGGVQQLERAHASPTSVEGRYDAANPICSDRLARADAWRSTARASFRGASEGADAELRATMTPGAPKAHALVTESGRLAAYRSRWLSDESTSVASRRFQTEAGVSLAAAVEPRFQYRGGVRALRGRAKSVDRLRAALFARHGVLAAPVLRRSLGVQGAVALLESHLDRAAHSIPDCAGAKALRETVRVQATRLVPKQLARSAA